MNKPKSIHFVGIKGVGMTPLAIIAKEAGITVTGSDLDESFITDVPLEKSGIAPLAGFSPDHVGDVDLVITTNAHQGFDNPEVIAAKSRTIPVLTKGEAVGAYMEGTLLGTSYKGVSVAGTHGKTTTSAMLATLAMNDGKDPGYLIGTSEIPSLGGMPGHFGLGSYFIAEADEYVTEPNYIRSPQFLYQHPEILIITNIDHDHPDVYETIADVREAFLKFASQLPKHGVVILCGDGEQAKLFTSSFSGSIITYGFSPLNDVVVSNYRVKADRTSVRLESRGTILGDIELQVGGEHNSLNATAALLAGREMNIPVEASVRALRLFRGTKRRLEKKGKLPTGAVVYDDYAHHPTEIASSLRALKSLYPEREIVCIFQPHTYSRTKQLFNEFAGAFRDADTVVLLPIFASARELPDAAISSEMLAEALEKNGKNVLFLQNRSDVIEYIDQNRLSDSTVLVTMGAGDIYKVFDALALEQTDDNGRR